MRGFYAIIRDGEPAATRAAAAISLSGDARGCAALAEHLRSAGRSEHADDFRLLAAKAADGLSRLRFLSRRNVSLRSSSFLSHSSPHPMFFNAYVHTRLNANYPCVTYYTITAFTITADLAPAYRALRSFHGRLCGPEYSARGRMIF